MFSILVKYLGLFYTAGYTFYSEIVFKGNQFFDRLCIINIFYLGITYPMPFSYIYFTMSYISVIIRLFISAVYIIVFLKLFINLKTYAVMRITFFQELYFSKISSGSTFIASANFLSAINSSINYNYNIY